MHERLSSVLAETAQLKPSTLEAQLQRARNRREIGCERSSVDYTTALTTVAVAAVSDDERGTRLGRTVVMATVAGSGWDASANRMPPMNRSAVTR